MDDLSYWFKTYAGRVQEYEKKVDGIGSGPGSSAGEVAGVCGRLAGKAEKEKRSLEHEIRLVRDPDAKAEWKDKVAEVDARLAAAKRALTMKAQQAELFGGGGGAGRGGAAAAEQGRGGGGGYVGPSNDEYLSKAEGVHDQIDASLQNTLTVVTDTETLGQATAEQLKAQGEQIRDISGTILTMGDALKRSEALLRSFQKRMASDRLIQAFFVMNALALVGIIILVAMQHTDFADDDTGNTPDDDAPSSSSSSSGRRLGAVRAARHYLRW